LHCTAKIARFVNKAKIAEKLHATRSQFSRGGDYSCIDWPIEYASCTVTEYYL